MGFRKLALGVLGIVVLSVIAWPILAQEAAKTSAETPAKTTAEAPAPDELALDVGNAQEANRAALSKYSWHMNNTLNKGGEEMATSVNALRFDTSGKVQTTNISSTSNVEMKRGLRGRKQSKEMDDFTQYLQQVLDLSTQYIFMSKGNLVDVFDRAKIAQSADSISVTADSLFVAGDKLVLVLDPKSKLTRKLSFNTTLQGDVIQGVVDYGAMSSGLVKAVKMQLDIPAKEVQIITETSDWVKQE